MTLSLTFPGEPFASFFDSPEEYEFALWCIEAKDAGLIETIEYHPAPFVLSERAAYSMPVQTKTKEKIKEFFILHPHEYTADYKLRLTDRGRAYLLKFNMLHHFQEPNIYIDVKGAFSMYNDAKPFSINQKWVYDKYGVFIYKAVPRVWFKKTWVPTLARRTVKTGKLRDCYLGFKTISELQEGGLI